ncbi:MAG: hypothetical protein HQL54_12360 [Magnetococcales bacterium]|nr:hypothetical protein [Magnetococcales bacterium]
MCGKSDVNKDGEHIKAEGFQLIPIRMRRSGHGLFGELLSLIELIHIYRTERPDVVHHVAIKPVIFGSYVEETMDIVYGQSLGRAE